MAEKGTIGTKIVLDGEKEYRDGLKAVGKELKELNSEMVLTAKQFSDNKNSIEALGAKYDVLTKQVSAQKEKVDIYTKAVSDCQNAEEAERKNVEKLTQEYQQAHSELKSMEDATEQSGEALKKQGEKVAELSDKLDVAKTRYQNAENATKDWSTSLNYAKVGLSDYESELQKTEGYLKEAKESMDGCAKSVDKYGKKTKEASEESEKFTKKTKEGIDALSTVLIAGGLTKGLEKTAEELMECTEKAQEFGISISKLGTVADTSSVSMQEMKKDIIEVSNNLNIAATSIAETSYQAISASVETGKAAEMAANATKLAIGGFTDSATAVDVLTTSLNAYDLSITDTITVSDKLITTQNLGKTTVGELASNMGKVIPIAASYNTNISNLTTAYAELTKNGIATAESTTYLKAMLNELGDGGSAVGKILEEKTGKSFSNLMKSGKTLGDVIQVLGDSVDGDRAAFNGLWSSSEAGVGALTLLKGGAESFNTTLEKMENSAGATERAFNMMADTTEYAKQGMIVALDNLKIAIGDELNPALEDLYESGENAFVWATEFVEENPKVVSAITALIAGIAVFSVAIVGVTAVINLATIATTAWTAVTAVAAAPLVLLGAAVSGVIAAIGILMTVQQNEREETRKVIEKNKEEIQTIKEKREEIEKNLEENKKEIESIRKMREDLDALSKKESLNTDEKSRMVAITSELNEVFPELCLQIDNQTGMLVGNTEEIEKNIVALERQYEVEFMKKDLEEIARAKYDAERKLAELQEERTVKAEKLAEAEEVYKSKLGESTEVTYGYAAAANSCGNEMIPYKTAMDNATYAINAYDEQIKETQSEIDALSEKFTESNDELQNVTKTTQEASAVQVEYKGGLYQIAYASEETAKKVEEIKQAYAKAKEEAHNSIASQVGLFEELRISSDVTATQMAQNLGSQTDAFASYKDNILAAEELVEKGLLDEGLLGSIMQLGMDGAGYLQELVTASSKSTEEFDKIMAEWAEMTAAKEALAEAMADVQTGYSNSMEELLGIVQEKWDTANDETATYTKNMTEPVEEMGKEQVKTVTKSMEDMNKAITTQAPIIVSEVKKMSTDIVRTTNTELGIVEGRSSKFYSIGLTITSSLAKAIDDGSGEVVAAVKRLVDSAVDAVDTDEIASKIDRMIGSRIS